MLPRFATATVHLCVLAGLMASAGCATTAPSQSSSVVPRDFSVSVAVGAGAGELEPAWYLLEADGTLRAALGAPTPQSPIPPRVRTLTPGARAAVWDAVESAQWIPQKDSTDAAADLPPDPGARELAEVYVAANGGRWSGRVVEAPGSPRAERLARVVRELRRLAWLPVEP